MNHALIRDEGHRNRMTVDELAERMALFLSGEYDAVIFDEQGMPAGYALYRRETEYVYLRQFYVAPEYRRRGIGRRAIEWLRANPWRDSPRVRIEVLVNNTPGIAFWRAVGFADYAVTMEWDRGA